MKRVIRVLFLTAVLAAILCIGALAGETDTTPAAGVYNVKISSGTAAAFSWKAAEGTAAITAQAATIKTVSYSDYYPGAVKFDLTVTGLTANSQYLLLVMSGASGTPTSSNIVYIDQTSDSSGSVSFSAYPSSLADGAYRVYLVGSDRAFTEASPLATFSYYAPYVLGDVNEDGRIDTSDALLVLQHIVKNVTLTGNKFSAADVAATKGVIDTSDALRILQYIVKNISTFE